MDSFHNILVLDIGAPFLLDITITFMSRKRQLYIVKCSYDLIYYEFKGSVGMMEPSQLFHKTDVTTFVADMDLVKS